jgi:hypothetical protein
MGVVLCCTVKLSAGCCLCRVDGSVKVGCCGKGEASVCMAVCTAVCMLLLFVFQLPLCL